MSWWRSSKAPAFASTEVAELLTTTRRFPPKVERETVSLSEAEAVRRWIRALDPEADQQVHVRRRWGTVVAIADREHPVQVILADGEHSWVAEPPESPDANVGQYTDLTLEQVEHVMVDALTSPEQPEWPKWSLLV